MALNVEMWVRDIVENFFPNNEFIARSVDHSMYVNGRTVHVPNAGLAPEITKNSTEVNLTATKRTDTDLEYSMDVFRSKPVYVQLSEEQELSYDKRMSVMGQMKAEIQRVAAESILASWVPASGVIVKTSGATVAAHIPSATGNRNAMSVADVMAVKKEMDKADIPSEGRCMMLDADMYNQLLESMTNAQVANFLAGADVATGVIGKFMGFDFYMRSKVLKATSTGAKKEWSASAAATDVAAGLAWHPSCVSRALGQVTVFADEKSPAYYGDVMDCEVRAGGCSMRSDKKGVVLIYQGTATA